MKIFSNLHTAVPHNKTHFNLEEDVTFQDVRIFFQYVVFMGSAQINVTYFTNGAYETSMWCIVPVDVIKTVSLHAGPQRTGLIEQFAVSPVCRRQTREYLIYISPVIVANMA